MGARTLRINPTHTPTCAMKSWKTALHCPGCSSDRKGPTTRTPHLCNEVMEDCTPLPRLLLQQLGRRVARDHEDDAQRVHLRQGGGRSGKETARGSVTVVREAPAQGAHLHQRRGRTCTDARCMGHTANVNSCREAQCLRAGLARSITVLYSQKPF